MSSTLAPDRGWTVRVLALVCLLTALCAPADSRAATGQPPAGTPAAQAAAIAERVAKAWTATGVQRKDGQFSDYILNRPWVNAGPRDHYGPAMLGAALVLNGLRSGRRNIVLSGLKAVAWAANNPWPDKTGNEAPGIVFEDMALAVTYDETYDQLAGVDAYKPYVKAWVTRLRHIRYHLFPPVSFAASGARPYYNWYLIEGLAVAALWDLSRPDGAHLTSTAKGAILAHPDGYVDEVTGYLNARFGGIEDFQVTSYGGLDLGLLSDPPENPAAYDIFSLALFSKIVTIVSTKIQEGRKELDEQGLGAWALMGPDGDVSWFGRSQEQAWTLGMAASGLFAISRTQGIERPDAGRMRSAGARALVRLQQGRYLPAPRGLWITPSLQQGVTRTATNVGMDLYATAAGYTGLTTLGLEWVARDAAAADPVASEGIAADAENGGYRLGTSNGSFIMRRTANVWFSVKSAPAQDADYTTDLRYESGLTAVQVFDQAGWHRVVPPRPNTHADDADNRHKGYDPVGPVLVSNAGVRRSVGGKAEKDDSIGGVVISARYALQAQEPLGPQRDVRYRPVACGVQIIVQANLGERWQYSAFFQGTPTGSASAGLHDSSQIVRAWGPDGAPGTILLHRVDRISYASGEHQHLLRRRFDVVAARDGPVTFQVCRPGMPGA